MKRPLILLVFCGSLMSGMSIAAPARYACPTEIPASSFKVTSPQPGWSTFVGGPLYLNSAAPADGPPERLGVLRGQDGKSSRGSWTNYYSLEGRYPEGKWLRCDYGMLHEVSLAMRLPDDIKECTVTGKKGQHAGENELVIACK